MSEEVNRNEKIWFGDKIKHLMELNNLDYDDVREGLTEKKVKEKANINNVNWNKYLNDVRRPTIETLVDLVRIFNTNLDYMCGISDFRLSSLEYDYPIDLMHFIAKNIRDHLECRYQINVSQIDEYDCALIAVLMSNGHLSEEEAFEDIFKDPTAGVEYYLSVVRLVKMILDFGPTKKLDDISSFLVEYSTAHHHSTRPEEEIETITAKNEKIDHVIKNLERINQENNKMIDILKGIRDS